MIDTPVAELQTVGEVVRWVVGGLVAVAGFVAVIVRWMMARIDANQKSLEEALSHLGDAQARGKEKDVEEATFRANIVRTQESLASTQQHSLELLQRMVTEMRLIRADDRPATD
ncbi:MAG: hypothetical protein EKK62_09565 [Acidimicrobiia bacterium]|nr:MAG: hypothetical protein EKK62_09565 [Acidimicrobiia bacterium]